MNRAQRFFAALWDSWRYVNWTLRVGQSVQERRRLQRVMRRWGQRILFDFRITLEVIGKPSKEPVIYVGNHISYLDIPLLMSQVPVVFLAKKELAKWPIFGRAMKSVGTVFVDRGSPQSRKMMADSLSTVLATHRQPIAIFPSGTTTLDENKPWRAGIFAIAKSKNIPIQPFRLTYDPLRASAFIDKDALLPHMWNLLRTPIKARLEFGEPRGVEAAQKECDELWDWCQRQNKEKP